MIATLWQNDLRHWLFVVNVIVFVVIIVYVVRAIFSPKQRSRSTELEKLPANIEPFLPDEDLEGRRLERVQGWALIFAAVIAIALPIYWLREPTRQHQSTAYFNENAVHRGAVLFASPGTPDYEAATSKQCANCHGEKGQGGTATARINGVQVAWKAPPLNTELLRFAEESDCGDPSAIQPNTVCEVTQIITYGRPGTPMQGWGVAGGGPLNPQSISDLVAFIQSIQLTPAQSQQQVADGLAAARSTNPNTACPEYVSCAAVAVSDAKTKLASDNQTLATAAKAARTAVALPDTTTNEALASACKQTEAKVPANPSNVEPTLKKQAIACSAFDDAAKAVADSTAAYNWTLDWQTRRANISDGQILFEMVCARCHTQGWSVFDPTAPPSALDGVNILGLAGGGGGTGGGIAFNLRGGDTQRRFGTDEEGGWQKQVDFVGQGSRPNLPYGITGIGTGKMPGFASMLTGDDIAKIVSYERYCLEGTDFKALAAACDTPTKPRTPPSTTTTTTAAKAGG